jgi:Protein of unknown function (DUF4232)
MIRSVNRTPPSLAPIWKRPPFGRAVAAAVATVVGGLVLTACSSATAGNGTADASSTSVSPSATASATASAADSSTAAPSATVTVTATLTPTTSASHGSGCTNAQIAVTWTSPPGGGAAGHDGVVLLFTNHSSTSCTLTGYPGVAGLDAAGHTVANAARTLGGMIGFCNCTTPPVLTLPPGDVVSAVVEGTAGGPGPCTAFPSMLVTPPNTTTSTRIYASPYSCGFDVHPVVTGQAGQA